MCQKVLVSFLSQQGYEVTGAATVKAFWHKFEEISPDLVILDVMLPDGNGFSLVHRIRLVDAVIPILVVSSLDDPSDRVAGLVAGADIFLNKPVNLTELAAIVKRNLSRQITIRQRQDAILSCSHKPVSLAHSWLLREQGKCLTNPSGITLALNAMEFTFLHALANKDGVVSRQSVSDKIGKGLNSDEYDGALSTLVCRLKKRWRDLANQDLPVRSLRKQGYLFSESIELVLV